VKIYVFFSFLFTLFYEYTYLYWYIYGGQRKRSGKKLGGEEEKQEKQPMPLATFAGVKFFA